MPQSRADNFTQRHAGALAEATWLVALVAVPLFVDRFADGPFEPPKVRLLVALCWVLLGTLALRAGAALRADGRWPRWPGRPDPIMVAALAFGASAIISTALSINPGVSLRGDVSRAQGLTTTFLYILIFGAVATQLRSTLQVRRLLTAIVLASTVVAVAGLGQNLGLEPFGISVDTARRATSTLGNPIFLAAFLSFGIVLSVTLATIDRGRARMTWSAAAVLQGVAFIGAGSRGPALGLVAALLAFLALRLRGRWQRAPSSTAGAKGDSDDLVGASPTSRRRWVAVVVVLAVAAIIAAAQWPEEIARATRLAKTETIRVRLQAWETVSRTMLAPVTTASSLETPRAGLRMPFGYGPETAAAPLGVHIGTDLDALARQQGRLDRAHNVVLQQLVERGSLGVLALLVLWYVLLRRAIGLAIPPAPGTQAGTHSGNSPPRARRATIAAATSVGLIVPWLVSGSLAMAGLTATAALLATTFWPVLRSVGTTARDPGRTPERVALAAGIGAALVGHIVELQSGIVVTPTALAFWVLAGVLASPWGRGGEVTGTGLRASTTPWLAAVAIAGMLSALAEPARTAGGLVPTVKAMLLGTAHDPRVAWLLLGTAVAALAIPAVGLTEHRPWRGLRTALGATLGALAIAGVPLLLLAAGSRFHGADPLGFATLMAGSAMARMVAAVLVVVALAHRASRDGTPRGRGTAIVVVAGLGLGLALQWSATSAADLRGLANRDAASGSFDAALQLYAGALEREPQSAQQWRRYAAINLQSAEAGSVGSTEHLDVARAALERAVTLDPHDREIHAQLGTVLVHQAIAAEAAVAILDPAIEHLERALELSPVFPRARAMLRTARSLREAIVR